jgi:hypothetical protein
MAACTIDAVGVIFDAHQHVNVTIALGIFRILGIAIILVGDGPRDALETLEPTSPR